jgi:hypothetical protein
MLDTAIGVTALFISLSVGIIQLLNRLDSKHISNTKVLERVTSLETSVTAQKASTDAQFALLRGEVDKIKLSCDKHREAELKVNMLWQMVEQNLPKLLHSPIHHEKDSLLEKMVKGELNLEQARRLRDIIHEELAEVEELSKRSTGALVLWALELRILELAKT